MLLKLFIVVVFSIYWDLDTQTNAVIREHPPTNHLPPHPEMELQRAQLVTKLRQHYHELCHQREGTLTPDDSLLINKQLYVALRWSGHR